MLSDVRILQLPTPADCPLVRSGQCVLTSGGFNSGYYCSYNPGIDNAQTCFRHYTTGSFPTVQCSRGTSNKFSYLTVPATVTATQAPTATGGSRSTTVAVLEEVLVYAPLIQINWQSTDRPSSTPLPGSTTSATSQTATPTSSTATPRPSGLSQGATIGIAVAAAIVGLVLVGALIVWMRRRRQRPGVMPTLPPDSFANAGKPHGMGGDVYVAEAPTERSVHEVDGLNKGGAYGPHYEMAG